MWTGSVLGKESVKLCLTVLLHSVSPKGWECGRPHRACPGLSQRGPSSERRKWTWSPIPNLEATANWQPLVNKKLVSSSGVSLGTQTTPKGRPLPSSRWPTQSELNDIFVDFLLPCIWAFLSSYWPFACLLCLPIFVCTCVCLSVCMCVFCFFFVFLFLLF